MMWINLETGETIKCVDGEVIVTDVDGFTKFAQYVINTTWESLNDCWMDDERYERYDIISP